MPRGRRSTLSRDLFTGFQARQFQQDVNRGFAQLDGETFLRGANMELKNLFAESAAQYGLQSQATDAERFAQEEAEPDKWLIGGLGSFLSGALDLLGRPGQAVAGAALAVQEGESPWKGIGTALGGTPEEREDYNFATWLERGGMGGIGEDNEGLRNVLGFAMDMVLDPLNIFGFAKARHLTRVAAMSPWRAAEATIPGAARLGERVAQAAFEAKQGVQTLLAKFTPAIGQTQEMQLNVYANRLRRNARVIKNAKKRSDMEKMADAIQGRGAWQGHDLTEIRAGQEVTRRVRGGLIGMKRIERNIQRRGIMGGLEEFERGLAKSFTGEGGGARAKAFVRKVRESPDLQSTLAEMMYRARGFEGGVLGQAVRAEADDLEEALQLIKRTGKGRTGDEVISYIDAIVSSPAWSKSALTDPLDYTWKGYRERGPGARPGAKSKEVAIKQMTYENNVRTLHDLGLTQYVRYITGEFSGAAKQVDQLSNLLELLPTGALAESLGVLTRNELYHRIIMPTKEGLLKFMQDDPGIRKRLSTKRLKLDTESSLDELVEQGLNLDVFAVTAYDIAQTRSLAAGFALFDTEFMRALGFRWYNEKGMGRRRNSIVNRLTKAMGAPSASKAERLMTDVKARMKAGEIGIVKARGMLVDDLPEPRSIRRVSEKTGRETVITKPAIERKELIDDIDDYLEKTVMLPGELANKYSDGAHGLVYGMDRASKNLALEHGVANDALRLDEAVGLVDEVREATIKHISKRGNTNVVVGKMKAAPDVILGPEEVIKAFSAATNVGTMSGILRVSDAVHSIWKPIVTVLPTNVSYFTRNLAGLVFLGLTSGNMNPLAMTKWNARAARLQKMGAFDSLPDAAKKLPDPVELRNGWRSANPPDAAVPTDLELQQAWIKEMADQHLRITYSYSTEALEKVARRGMAAEGIRISDDPATAGQELAQWLKRNKVDTGDLQRGSGSGHGAEVLSDMQDVTQTIKYDELEKMMDVRGVVGGGHRELSRVDFIEGEGAFERLQRRMATWGSKVRGEKVPIEVQSKGMFNIAAEEYFESWFKTNVGYNPIRWGSTLAMAMDDNFKIGGFLHRIFDKGDTLDEAAEWVRRVYYNYDEVGEWTKNLSGVFPFARWSRLNIPRMIELVTTPQQQWKVSKISRAEGTVQEAYADWLTDDAAMEREGIEFEASTLPDWILERHHIVLGQRPDGSTRVIYGLGLPIEDLNKLFAGTDKGTMDNLASEVGPLFKMPIEGMVANRSFFTGEAITDPTMRNFYRRAFSILEKVQVGEPGIEEGWASGPSAPLNLKNWLQIDRVERPEGGYTYSSRNPMAMYILGTLIGRPLGVLSKGVEVIEAEDEGTRAARIADMATGMKIRDVFPPPHEGVPLAQRTIDNPQLAALVDQYYSIPIYESRYMTSDESVQAFAGYNMARSIATSLMRLASASGARISEQDAMDTAFTRVGTLFPYGDREELARRIWNEKIPQRGRKARVAFIKQNPILELAMKELGADDIAWMLGELDYRNIPRFLRG